VGGDGHVRQATSIAASGAGSGLSRRRAVIPWWGWVLLLVAVESVVVLGFFRGSHAQVVGGDGAEYLRYALNLLNHGVFSESASAPYYPGVVRSPGYPAFLAVFYWVGGGHDISVQVAQVALVAGMALLVGWVGRVVAGATVGTVAALLCATYLPFVEFTTHFMTEDAASFCLTVFVALLLLARRAEQSWLYASSGLALAVLTYVRPEFLLLAVPVALILLARPSSPWRSMKRWRACLAFSCAFVLALVPWTVRNASVTGGRLLPMAATSGSDLLASADQYSGFVSYKFTIADWHRYEAQARSIAPVPVGAPVAGIQGSGALAQVHSDDLLRSAAFHIFESLSVGTIIRSVPKRLAYLWGTADSPPPGRWSNTFHRTGQLQYGVLLLLLVIGLVIRRRQLLRDWPLWVAAAYLTLIHLVAHIEGRYTLPARPPLLVYAAVGACVIGAWVSRRLQDASGPLRRWRTSVTPTRGLP
jgi:4-amino-4-deoxy-L-arabinose transferase-like glycosyltransferase